MPIRKQPTRLPTVAEIVRALDALEPAEDYETAESAAIDLLLRCVPPAVQKAYDRFDERYTSAKYGTE